MMLNDGIEFEAKRIARSVGHKDVDHIIVCDGGGRVPVWKFYIDAAKSALKTAQGKQE